MQDRIETGRAYSFYREELSGLSIARIYTRYLTRPEPPLPAFFGVRERETFGKKEDSSVLFTENDAFEVTFRGARPVAADRYARFRESTLRNIFYILRQRLGEPGLVIESLGSDVIDNQPVVNKFGRYASLKDGSDLLTQDGRVELVLTPNAYLRVGQNSGVRLISGDLSGTKVELLSGSAILDSGNAQE